MSHQNRRTTEQKICRNCRQPFYPFRGRQDTSNFCSHGCYLKARWGESRVKEFECLHCRKIFSSFASNKRKFCSPECSSAFRKGKPLTPEHSASISRAHKKRPWTPERQAQVIEAGKHRKYGKAMRDKIRAATIKQLQSNYYQNRTSSIEIMLQEALTHMGITYQTHQPIDDICVPDIVIPEAKLAIFADGDYWHSKPKVKQRDIRQDFLLLQRGWYPLRFPESYIREHAADCALQIKSLLTTAVNR